MTKILHLSRTMGNGGAEKVVYQLASDLKDQFEEVIVASTGGIWVEKLTLNNIRHYDILDMENKSPKTIVKNIKRIYQIIKTHNIKVVHTHHRMAAFYITLIQKIIPSLKHVYTAHNIFQDKLKFYNYAISGAYNVAVGKGVSENLINDVGVKDVSTIYNSVMNHISEDIVDNITEFNGIKIGCIARLAESKGISYLIDSLKYVRNKNIRVYIIGDGTLRQTLRQQVTQLGLQEQVVFLGYRSDVSACINSLDFLVLPSLFEGLPLSLIEFFMHKKTVIATNIPGNNEIVTNNNGILVEVKNSQQIAQAIDKLIDNSQLRKTLEKNAYQDYMAKFTYDRFLRSYTKLYQTL